MTTRPAAFLFLLFAIVSASAQVVPQRVRVSEGVSQGLLINKVDPVYPPLAKQARIQGSVILQVVISKSGDVENVQLFSGHPLLAPAAIDAVKQWRYKPYLLNGEPVEVETRVRVNFTLAEGVAGDHPGGQGADEPGSIAPSDPGSAEHAAIPRRVRVSSGVSSGLVVTKVPPKYPPDAREQRVQGTVVMSVNIDGEGNVANIQLISGHPLLAPAAIEAVKQWKYRPYLLNGSPVEVETQVQVNFILAN